MKKGFEFLFAVALLMGSVACNKEVLVENQGDIDTSNQSITLWASQPEETKVIYSDGLGTNGKGDGGFTMRWENGDVLYAIMWDDAANGGKGQATDKYIVLTTAQDESRDGNMLFSGTPYGGLNINTLQGGEHFVLVHGHFVLDADTDGGVIDFPTSEVTKDGYASHIHYGGVENGNNLTFRSQDGTLANLKNHEYMVADAYVRFHTEDNGQGEEVSVVPYLSGSKDGNPSRENPDREPQGVTLLSAHTLLRLTLFLPDGMFSASDDKLLAVSVKTVNNDPIFHRYFRLHPNTKGEFGPNGWKEDWNDKADKEANAYIRANMPGTRSYNVINDPSSDSFDRTKTVCVGGELNSKTGHYITLYFSLPSRPLALDNSLDTPSELNVSVFTKTQAYRSKKSYTIARANMIPGKIVNLNVSFAGDNLVTSRVITDPNLGVSFSPGLVYATKSNSSVENWTYGIYTNQGEYAGLNQQTDCLGDYFIFGSVDPRQVYHQHKVNDSWTACSQWNSGWSVTQDLSAENDVASKVEINGVSNIFSSMTVKEAQRVWARIEEEAKRGVNKGFYYYNASAHDVDALHHTAHQAVGAWRNLSENDPRRMMSSTIGIWIGTSEQPSLADQDMYVFIPSSHQISNSSSNMLWYDSYLNEYFADENESGDDASYVNSQEYRYPASKEYAQQHVWCIEKADYDKLSSEEQKKYVNIPTKDANDTVIINHYYLLNNETNGKDTRYGLLGDYSNLVMKFSTNTRAVDPSASRKCQRFQLWYKNGPTTNPWTGYNVGLASMEQTFGRVVRPVIY